MISFSFVYQYPIQFSSLLLLALSLASLWIRKSFWIWGSLLLISLLGAFTSDLFNVTALFPLIFFALLLWGLQLDLKGFSRFLISSMLFLIGAGLFFHLMPGFVDPKGLPYPLCLNYGKPFIGILLLGWLIPTLSRANFPQNFKRLVAYVLIGTIFLTTIFVVLQPKAIYPNFSFSIFPWAFISLFFFIIPEEALLRGFLQNEIVTWMGGGLKSEISGVIITTLLYPLFHLTWVSDLSLLIPTFAAGFTYAACYQITKLVETSIVCHFLIGCIHFLFFGHLPLSQKLSCVSFGL